MSNQYSSIAVCSVVYRYIPKSLISVLFVTLPQWINELLNCILSDDDSWSLPCGKVAKPLAQQCPAKGLKLLRNGKSESLLL